MHTAGALVQESDGPPREGRKETDSQLAKSCFTYLLTSSVPGRRGMESNAGPQQWVVGGDVT